MKLLDQFLKGMIMHFNEFIRTLVGADLSRPAPIYRPRWMFR